MPQGGIGHAGVEIGGAALMLADALPPEYPPTSTLINLHVAECDAVCAQALAAGAASVADHADQFYGDPSPASPTLTAITGPSLPASRT